MKTYRVRAKRWEHGWELHIENVGVTQSRTLWDAEDMARDLIGRREDVPRDEFTVTITPAADLFLQPGDLLAEDELAALQDVPDGRIDLGIVPTFAPDLTASGTLNTEATVRGTLESPQFNGRLQFHGAEAAAGWPVRP